MKKVDAGEVRFWNGLRDGANVSLKFVLIGSVIEP